MYKMLEVVDYNIGLLEKTWKEYESLPVECEYKLASLNDNKSALFFKLLEDVRLLKGVVGYT